MIVAARTNDKRPRVRPGAVFISTLVPVLALVLGHHAAAAGPEDLVETQRATAVAAVTGDTLKLDGIPNEVRLAGIQTPRGRAGRTGMVPFAAAAQEGLAGLVLGHVLSLRSLPVSEDRDGRLRAEVLRDDGLWLQAEMVRRGLARVAISTDTALFAETLLGLERDARTRRRGLWSHPAYTVRSATDIDRLSRDIGTFQLVVGRIVGASKRGDTIYLDFDDDYRSDFTATIPRDAWSLFAKVRIKPLALTGRQVQVRGWIARRNGPALEIVHPAALELLDDAPAPKPRGARRPK